MRIQVWFAEVDWSKLTARWNRMTPGAQDRFVILGALGGVILLVLVWALFIRKKARRSRSHHHSQHHSYERARSSSAPGGGKSDPGQPPKRRKWRRQRREHRPRNPTLAQTGGLPPIRTEKPPEPSP